MQQNTRKGIISFNKGKYRYTPSLEYQQMRKKLKEIQEKKYSLSDMRKELNSKLNSLENNLYYGNKKLERICKGEFIYN